MILSELDKILQTYVIYNLVEFWPYLFYGFVVTAQSVVT